MRRAILLAIAGLMVGSLLLVTPLAARAANQFEIDVSPIYFLDGTGDSNAPPPVGTLPFYCTGPGSCGNAPRTTNNWRIDYGLTYHINRRWAFAYTHSNFDFSLGRIVTITPFSILSGSVDDRTDKLALNYLAGHGLTLSAYYSSHQRSALEATSPYSICYFNSISCVGGSSNPSSIDSNSWSVGGTYAFGPHGKYQPPMFNASFNVNYFPRPTFNCPEGALSAYVGCANAVGEGLEAPTAVGYSTVGSSVVYGYGLTMFPFVTMGIRPGTIPFVGYESLPVFFHAEQTPEVYNVVDGGLLQILPHDLSASFTYFKLQGRYSSDTIPTPDVVRSVTFLFKLSYAIKF
ncbi:MAG TPA: hypothetical protein VMA98_06495 [Candidatus Acidoferrales bacterium]|nr:hypothetical protein [Candidatus Acidoferrales bacterium]